MYTNTGYNTYKCAGKYSCNVYTIIYMQCVGNNMLCARLGATYLLYTYTVANTCSLALLVVCTILCCAALCLLAHSLVVHATVQLLLARCMLRILLIDFSSWYYSIAHSYQLFNTWSTATRSTLATIFTSMWEGMVTVSPLGYVLYMPTVTMTSLCKRVSRRGATMRVYICYIHVHLPVDLLVVLAPCYYAVFYIS